MTPNRRKRLILAIGASVNIIAVSYLLYRDYVAGRSIRDLNYQTATLQTDSDTMQADLRDLKEQTYKIDAIAREAGAAAGTNPQKHDPPLATWPYSQ